MEENWYYAKGQQQLGPVSIDELRGKIAGGEVAANDLVWRAGMNSWQPAARVPELFPAGAGGTGVAPAPPLTAYPQQQQQQPYTGAAPQPLQYGGYAPQYGTPPPPNYLVQSILATLFCCWPMGIPAIVFSAQVNSKHATGDMAGAMESSRKARFWMLMSFWFGFAPMLLYLIIAVIAGIAEATK